MTRFLKVGLQNQSNKAFFVPSLRSFDFPRNFAMKQIRGYWLQMWQHYFQIPAPKYKSQVILWEIWGIFFDRIFPTRQIWGWWFQFWQYCFQIPTPKYPKQTFFLQNLVFVFFRKILQIAKFEVPEFKYDNSFFLKFSPKMPNKAQLFFFFKFWTFTNMRVLICNMTIVFFKIYPKFTYMSKSRSKVPNNVFLVPNLGIAVFPRIFAIWQIWGCWFLIWQ